MRETIKRKKRLEEGGPPHGKGAILHRAVEKIKDTCCCGCDKKVCCKKVRSCFPFLDILTGYSALYDLPVDIIAGLTVGIMHIPQGMAYALLTQLPPVYGLYTSFFPVLIYFFFGTSRQMSVGTFAVVALMVGSVVDKGHVAWQRKELMGAMHEMAAGQNVTHMVMGGPQTPAPELPPDENATIWESIFPDQHLSQLQLIKVGYAMAVTFAVGLLQIFLGCMKLGFLTTFLSDPLISGFTTGAAVHVFSSQVKAAFGIKVKRFSGPLKLIFMYENFFENLNHTNIVSFTATIVSILVLMAIREGINSNLHYKKLMKGIPIPGELIVIIAGTIMSVQFELHKEFDVEVIGHIPKGFPTASAAFMKYVPDVLGESFAITFTGFAISFAIAKIMADKHNYTVDANQELIALGISNVLGAFVSSFVSSGSLSRSMVQDVVGGRTQIVSLVSSILVAIVLIALGPLFEALPNSILAAIIIVSLKGLFMQFVELKRLWKISKIDYSVWLVTFLATVFLDVDLGLLIGLIYNLVPILLRTQEPYTTLLGQLPDIDVYADTKVYREAVPVDGIKIFKFEAPLYFANMEKFKAALIKETEVDPEYLKKIKDEQKDTDLVLRHDEVCMGTSDTWPDDPCESHINMGEGQLIKSNCATFAIIIDGSCIQYVDSVTVRVLKEIVLEYRDVDIDVYLGECKAPVRVMLDSSGFYTHIARRHVCATIAHAVQVARKSAALSKETLDSCFDMVAEDFISEEDFAVPHLASSDESVETVTEEDPKK